MIHSTAILEGDITHPDDGSLHIGPYAVLRGRIRLGRNTRIGPHACIEGEVEMGDANTIGHGAIIGADPQDLGFDPSVRSGVRIGSGNTFREYVTIHRSTRDGGDTIVGDQNFLMAGSHLAHDVRVGNENVLANNVLLAGYVQLGNHTFLGGGSGYHQFIRIGDRAMVQGNAGMSQDVPPFVIAHGINLIAGLNVVGLRRAGVNAAGRAMLKKAFDLVYLAKLPLEEIGRLAENPEWPAEARQFLAFFSQPSRKGVCR